MRSGLAGAHATNQPVQWRGAVFPQLGGAADGADRAPARARRRRTVTRPVVDAETVSDAFQQRLLKRVQMECDKLYKYGLFVSEYTFMGSSPRIQPFDPRPGNSIFSLSVAVRYIAYKKLKILLDQKYGGQGLILDLDLVSCYMNILRGLYPSECSDLSTILNTEHGL